jgi:tetratricopeptide (TPR) repeat protein
MGWVIRGYTDEVDDDDEEDEISEGLRYYYRGTNLLDEGKINEALELFRKSLELENHFKTLEQISDCYDKLGLAEPALKYIELAYQVNPRNDHTACKFAEQLKNNNRLTEAKIILESILLRSPSRKKAQILLQSLNYESSQECHEKEIAQANGYDNAEDFKKFTLKKLMKEYGKYLGKGSQYKIKLDEHTKEIVLEKISDSAIQLHTKLFYKKRIDET